MSTKAHECRRCHEFHLEGACDRTPDYDPEPLVDERQMVSCAYCGRLSTSDPCFHCERSECSGCGKPLEMGLAMCGPCGFDLREQDWSRGNGF